MLLEGRGSGCEWCVMWEVHESVGVVVQESSERVLRVRDQRIERGDESVQGEGGCEGTENDDQGFFLLPSSRDKKERYIEYEVVPRAKEMGVV
ncbi:hypothetical protein COLO4_24537 [Corchorus olitorius]|uniref:Uncharacterized protein n=1 Tax=Corchorus olitorius TaxID=93759 RepID=A0A1R3I9A5_9ROSI|nr:hypothetical protein COLO4_24537 [Corchorus olitorius]